MSRRRISRREQDLLKGILVIAILLGFAWTFSPEFRALTVVSIVILGGVGLIVLIAYLVFRPIMKPSRVDVSRPITTATSPVNRESAHERAAQYGMTVTVHDRVTEPSKDERKPTEVELREKLRAIDWYQFEKLTELIFKDLGYKVERTGGAHPDGGIDMVIEKDRLKLGVQCKHWKKWPVRKESIITFVGALKVAGLSSGYYVTLRGGTEAADDLATKQMITFVDETNVMNLIRTEDGQVKPEMLRFLNDKNKYCPKCESAMVLREGGKTGKSFWGCSTYPRCDGKVRMDE